MVAEAALGQTKPTASPQRKDETSPTQRVAIVSINRPQNHGELASAGSLDSQAINNNNNGVASRQPSTGHNKEEQRFVETLHEFVKKQGALKGLLSSGQSLSNTTGGGSHGAAGDTAENDGGEAAKSKVTPSSTSIHEGGGNGTITGSATAKNKYGLSLDDTTLLLEQLFECSDKLVEAYSACTGPTTTVAAHSSESGRGIGRRGGPLNVSSTTNNNISPPRFVPLASTPTSQSAGSNAALSNGSGGNNDLDLPKAGQQEVGARSPSPGQNLQAISSQSLNSVDVSLNRTNPPNFGHHVAASPHQVSGDKTASSPFAIAGQEITYDPFPSFTDFATSGLSVDGAPGSGTATSIGGTGVTVSIGARSPSTISAVARDTHRRPSDSAASVASNLSIYTMRQLMQTEDPAGFTTLNSYTVIGELGAGTSGSVMLVCDTTNNDGERLFAIKKVRRGQQIALMEQASRAASKTSMNFGTQKVPIPPLKGRGNDSSPHGKQQHGTNSLKQPSSSKIGDIPSPTLPAEDIVSFPLSRPKSTAAPGNRPTPANSGGNSNILGINYDFRKEIAIMKKLKHPNLVKLHEVIDDCVDDHVYMVMDYVQGGPLLRIDATENHVTAPVEPIPEATIRSHFRQIASALRYLHRNRIAHLDIKPENILLNDNGDPVIIDFGVAHQHKRDGDSNAVNSPSKFGTPFFFSPEQCEGVPADEMDLFAADVWALGVTLYVMVFRKLPFFALSYTKLRSSIIEDPLAIPNEGKSASRQIVELIQQMLEKDPQKRLTIKQVWEHPFVKDYVPVMNRSNLRPGRSVSQVPPPTSTSTDPSPSPFFAMSVEDVGGGKPKNTRKRLSIAIPSILVGGAPIDSASEMKSSVLLGSDDQQRSSSPQEGLPLQGLIHWDKGGNNALSSSGVNKQRSPAVSRSSSMVSGASSTSTTSSNASGFLFPASPGGQFGQRVSRVVVTDGPAGGPVGGPRSRLGSKSGSFKLGSPAFPSVVEFDENDETLVEVTEEEIGGAVQLARVDVEDTPGSPRDK